MSDYSQLQKSIENLGLELARRGSAQDAGFNDLRERLAGTRSDVVEMRAQLTGTQSQFTAMRGQFAEMRQTVNSVCLEVARLGEVVRDGFAHMREQFARHDFEIRKNGVLLEALDHKFDLTIESFQTQPSNPATRVGVLEKRTPDL